MSKAFRSHHRSTYLPRPSGLRRCLRAGGAGAALITLTATAVCGLWALTSDLRDAAARGGLTPDEAVGLAAALGCWLCVGWFVLAVGCSVASAAPGVAGRLGASAAEVVAPWTLRKVVISGLGLTVAAGPGVAAALVASPFAGGATTRAGSGASAMSAAPGWSVEVGRLQLVSRGAGLPALDRVPPEGPAAHLPQLDRPAEPAPVMTVEPGDCLWTIASRSLGPAATDAEIARTWPAWYAANRAVIGDDPDLLQPGQQLVAPS